MRTERGSGWVGQSLVYQGREFGFYFKCSGMVQEVYKQGAIRPNSPFPFSHGTCLAYMSLL